MSKETTAQCGRTSYVCSILRIAMARKSSLFLSQTGKQASVFWHKATEDLISARQVRSGSYSR
jgi:hypothetical protein